jgi:hypothetical protein
MSAISLTRLYELLVPKLGKEATEGLITFTESKISYDLESNIKHLATKEDLIRLEARLEAKLEAKINKSQIENIRWMFLFWVGQVIATTGSILLFLKK